MVDVTTKVVSPGEMVRQRLARIKVPAKRPGIRVEPRDDDMRRLLKHPSGIRFRSEGSVEWPDDQFTHRRIKDGSVKVAGDAEKSHSASRRHETKGE